MLCKLVLVASLAVGVFGFDDTRFNPYKGLSRIHIIPIESCKEFNAEDKVPELKASITTFNECVMKAAPDDVTIRDIQEMTRTENYDGVVKKFCAKSPQLKKCIRGLIKGATPCLSPGKIGILENTFPLVDFLCHDDGARIISLIKYGPRCVNEKRTELETCRNEVELNIRKLFNGRSPPQDATVLMIVVVETEQCGIVDTGLSCVTNALKSCSSETPAQLSQKLHDLLLDSLACAGVSIFLQNGVLHLMLAMIFLNLLISKFNNKC